jgi:hypothetical protein
LNEYWNSLAGRPVHPEGGCPCGRCYRHGHLSAVEEYAGASELLRVRFIKEA